MATRYYNVYAEMENGTNEGIITDNPQIAVNKYIDFTSNATTVHITDLETGEVYAFFNKERSEWGTEINRGVSREFTEILAGLRV